MILQRSKLWQDKFVDIRSYELERLKKGENLVILYGGRKMTLYPEDIKSKKLCFYKTPVVSKINLGQTYILYSYLWSPDRELSEDEKLQKFSEQCL